METLYLKEVFPSEHLGKYDPDLWKNYTNEETIAVLDETKMIMLEALKIPAVKKYRIKYKRISGIIGAAQYQEDIFGGCLIKVSESLKDNGLTTPNGRNFGTYGDMCVSVIDAFSGIIHECIHIAQGYTTADQGLRYLRLTENDDHCVLNFRHQGRRYKGCSYMKDVSSVLAKDSQNISLWLHMSQYSEREAYAYTVKAVDLLLEFLHDRIPGELALFIKEDNETLHPQCIQHLLEDYFQCSKITEYIDKSLSVLHKHILLQGIMAAKIPKGVFDAIKCMSALSYDITYDIECDAIKKRK